MRRALAPHLAAGLLLVTLAGCGQSDDGSTADPGGDTPGTSDPDSTTALAPGDQYTSGWEPEAPAVAVDPATVEGDYTPVLDAVVDATDGDIDWGAAQVTTEEFDDEVCVVKVERLGDGDSSLVLDDLKQVVADAVVDLGFADLASIDDPGGAIKLVAHDSDKAFLEYRSKGETTIAVRVATTDTQCG